MSRDALVVGINTYQHLPGLRAPAQDAESVARCLESFGECRVVRQPEVITQQKPAIGPRGIVTTPMLEEALIKLFKPAGKNIPQTAIFYYSGHGLQRQAGIQEGYLATSDANPAAGHYGLSLHWLRRLLQESPVRQRVILLDCCNSGEFFNMLEADPGARAGTDRLFMAAAREYESAYESLDGVHSVFTQALLSGLNPYKVKGGIVNGHSLTDRVNRQLKGELQQPLFESSGSEIVLTRLAGMTTPTQDQPLLIERLQKLRYGFCPFPGAAPFESRQSEFFFGRDEIAQTLEQKVASSRLCALVGASGVGKTSLLKAGLVPRLTHGEKPWDVRYVVLDADPLRQIAEGFVDAEANGLQRAEQLRQAESFLRQGPGGFCQLVQAVAGDTPMVLILDQFEALLTPGPPAGVHGGQAPADPGHRRLIIDFLTAALQQDHLPLHLVLGLRSHHLESLHEFPEFQALVMGHCLAMPAMTYNQLKAAIVGPLDKVGLRYDANLVYTLLLDVVSAPADLAMLQMALKALWLRRETPANAVDAPYLTLAAYVEMGGIRQLLNQRATETYESLTLTEQAIAQRIFLGLCDLGDGATPSRRQLQLAELVTEAMPQTAVVATLDKLLAARLVVAQAQASGLVVDDQAVAVPTWASTTSPDQSLADMANGLKVTSVAYPNASPYFDIGHEALLRNWPLLQDWLQAQGSVVRQQRAIEVAAQDWQQQRQPEHPDYFLTKTRLSEAKQFQQAQPHQLSLQANDYLAACDRYNRRSRRQRYLVRSLIPISMITGMLTAYGHSHLNQPDPTPTNNSAVAPAFELLGPRSAQPPTLVPKPEDQAPVMGSPQAGVIRTNVFNWTLAPSHLLKIEPQLPTAQSLQTGLVHGTQGLGSLATTAPALGAGPAAAPQSAIAPITPGPGDNPAAGWPTSPSLKTQPTPPMAPASQDLPYANQVVSLESWWVSPEDPTMVIQIWCTQAQPEPVCFTSTAARGS
jgi:hypothetical protein